MPFEVAFIAQQASPQGTLLSVLLIVALIFLFAMKDSLLMIPPAVNTFLGSLTLGLSMVKANTSIAHTFTLTRVFAMTKLLTMKRSRYVRAHLNSFISYINMKEK